MSKKLNKIAAVITFICTVVGLVIAILAYFDQKSGDGSGNSISTVSNVSGEGTINNTVNITNTDNRIAAGDGSVIATGGSSVTINGKAVINEAEED